MINRILIILFLIFNITAGQVKVPDLQGYVNDFSGLLGSGQKSSLERYLSDFDESNGIQIVLVMLENHIGLPAELYCHELAKSYNLAGADNPGSLLIIFFRDEHKFCFETGQAVSDKLPGVLTGAIIRNEVKPFLNDNRYYEAVRGCLEASVSAIKGEYSPKKGKIDYSDKSFVILLGIIILVITVILINAKQRGNKRELILEGSLPQIRAAVNNETPREFKGRMKNGSWE